MCQDMVWPEALNLAEAAAFCVTWKRRRAVWWAHLGLPGHRLHADWRFFPGDGPELVVRSQLERKLPAPGRHFERQPQLGERLDEIYWQREEFRLGSNARSRIWAM